MEVTGGAEEGFIREWTPCSHILNLIPARIPNGLFSNELNLTCVDVVSEYIALGTNVGLVYWYDRKKGNMQKLKCEASTSPITFVKIVSTVDYMVGAGNEVGQVTVFQIPKEHPENVPDTFKPKVEPKVERYTIGDLHKSKITAIEWSKNGMRLFSGDKDGVIIMTEIDFYMHLCKSLEIVNEQHEIVQMSYHQNSLLVSSVYRTIVCERRDARWHVSQLGKKERKSLSALGAVFQHSYARGGEVAAYCARPGLRLWRADRQGNVLQTLLLKEAIANPVTVAELLNPAPQRFSTPREPNLGPLFVFRDQFLVSHDQHSLYVLDPRSLTAVSVVDQLRRILSVGVHKEEIFVLEGPRSLVRLAPTPSPALHAEEVSSPMAMSLSSLQQAVSSVRELAAPAVGAAHECFESPTARLLPTRGDTVLHSIINEFKDVSNDAEEIRRAKSEELQNKLKMYNSIMSREMPADLIHRRRTPGRSPRASHAPSPCRLSLPNYGIQNQNDDLLEKQIEEKEKILAKMLNLESLSITAHKTEPKEKENSFTYKSFDVSPLIEPPIEKKPHLEPKVEPQKISTVQVVKDPMTNLVPKVVKLPNNWNLSDIDLRIDVSSKGEKESIYSDDHIESDWEFV